MSRYFFHTRDGEDFVDHEGTELRDFTEARRQAVRLTGALLVDKPDNFSSSGEWTMQVTDSRDLPLFELTLQRRIRRRVGFADETALNEG